MEEAKAVEAVYTDAASGVKRDCLVVNSNVLISGVRYMGIMLDGERVTVPAKYVEIKQ